MEPHQDVAGVDLLAGENLFAFDDTHDEAREVVLAITVEARHFGRLATEQGDLVLRACGREATHDLLHDLWFEAPGGQICVDIFRRPDGSFGFEEFRRDPEDARGWYVVGLQGARRFASREEAEKAARRACDWMDAGSTARPRSPRDPPAD